MQSISLDGRQSQSIPPRSPRGISWALVAAGLLFACSTPNSSATQGFRIASVNGGPATQEQLQRDLTAVQHMLVVDGFSRIEAGPGPLAPPEHERIQFLFSWSDTTRFHGFVSVADDDTIHVFVVDNRRGEREGFGLQSCGEVLALRSKLREQFGDRLWTPAQDEKARQQAQLRFCE